MTYHLTSNSNANKIAESNLETDPIATLVAEPFRFRFESAVVRKLKSQKL